MKYYDIREKLPQLRAISIIIGGRGIGKTYSALRFLIEQGEKFIYLRNTKEQIDTCGTDFGNPFKKLNTDFSWDLHIDKEGKHFVIRSHEDGKKGEAIGYAAALSTFENLRGVDLSDVKYVLFDEFIERRTLTFDQFSSFVSFYETVNRNRELEGEEPLKVIMLSNAQKLGNPILAGYQIIPVIERMLKQNQRVYKTRFLYIELPISEVSDAKRKTANYQLIAGSQYAAEALDNEFAYDSFFNIGKKNILEYKAQCIIDGMTIYRHKAKEEYYACLIHADVTEFNSKDQRLIWMRTYGQYYREAYAAGKFYFSDFTTKLNFAKLISM